MRRFLSFRLDTANQCLWRGEATADLTPKAFDVLRYLVEHAGRLVTPDELLEALWPDIYINPEGLRRYIQEIRKALGDRPDKPVFIKTLLKRGYQFIAPVFEENTAQQPLDLTSEAAKKIVGRGQELYELDRCLGKAARGQRQILPNARSAGWVVPRFGKRIPCPDVGRASTYLAGTVSRTTETRTPRDAAARDPWGDAGAHDAGNL